MTQLLKILLPIFPTHCKETIYFKGYVSVSGLNETVIYITEFTTKEIIVDKNVKEDKILYGYCSQSTMKKTIVNRKNTLAMKNFQNPRIEKLVLNGEKVDKLDNCIIMLYEHDRIKNSETISDDLTNFSKLHNLMQNDNQPLTPSTYEPVLNSPSLMSSSMFIQHLLNYCNLINWLARSIWRDRKVAIKQGNLILAILIDLFLGYCLLQLLTQDKKELSSILMGLMEKLVNLLFSLLKWLMGAPAGLKLNNAFNKMLGKYFSYHIQLWWLFLDVSGEKLDTILHIYHCVGYLGFTFQAALVSDMISLATFHSYCIYVYAARLFNLQISGLIALLRLFVGRKYNPLRGGIDSCEYTNQELFVGTVAFTILLLLLPTTTMYYIVFTAFRLLSLIVQFILTKLIYIVQTLPLYVVTLWLARSPKVAGNILIEVANKEDNSPLLLRVKLFNKSINELVNSFRPPVEAPKNFEWSTVLSNVFTGKHII